MPVVVHIARGSCAPMVRGFTMVELVTVMAITGILAFMLVPRFQDVNKFDVRGFHDQAISALRYAQKAAIAQNRYVCATFAANSLTLTAGTDSLCTSNPGGSINLTGPDGRAPFSVSAGSVSFSPVPTNFSFDARGRPSLSQTITVSGYATPITVEAETGYVH